MTKTEELMYRTGLLRVAGRDVGGFNYFNEKFLKTQMEALGKHSELELDSKVCNAAMNELEKSFRYGKTRGMLMFFKDEDGKLRSDRFYDCDWVKSNGYGFTNPWKPDLIETGSFYFGTYNILPWVRIGRFHWDPKKLCELAKDEDLLVTCDTHVYLPYPDEIERACEAATGFGKRSDKVKNLVMKCSRGSTVGINEKELAKYIKENTKARETEVPGFSEERYKELVNECEPTVKVYLNKVSEIPSQSSEGPLRLNLPFAKETKYAIMDTPADL